MRRLPAGTRRHRPVLSATSGAKASRIASLIASGKNVRLVRKTAAGMSTPTTRTCSAATATAAVFRAARNV